MDVFELRAIQRSTLADAETANAIALFLRWVLDEDERRDPMGFAAAAVDCAVEETVAVTTLCWFLRWLVDEDERRALREFRAASVGVRVARDMDRAPASRLWHRLDLAEREMQRRGL